MRKTIFLIILCFSFNILFADNVKNAEGYYSRGLFKQRIPFCKLWAIQDYTKAIELNPKGAKFYEARGGAKLGYDDASAIKDLTKAIELNPKSGGAYLVRGMAKGNLENYLGELEDFTKAGELGVTDAYKAINLIPQQINNRKVTNEKRKLKNKKIN